MQVNLDNKQVNTCGVDVMLPVISLRLLSVIGNTNSNMPPSVFPPITARLCFSETNPHVVSGSFSRK